ncbi:LysR substrate-binding domain-containing protein [uncultured Methylobacterium sp.]|uniref:LysR substrate-binding domain-containing protein n=1 Tax=uncultured Methylobacterium sp. TaxID=157278 RepID=UPI00259135E2|nr:LysR substrate-binding domain-containing protein [uncultured Methylobacterium sp.]
MSASRSRLPPLNALRAFEAAGRHLSFRLAADELGVTQSAISHQIAALESYLQTDLFVREPRKIRLTRSGSTYLPFVESAFAKLSEGTGVVKRLGHRDSLFIETYTSFAVRWLMPRLSEVRKAYPDLDVRIASSQSEWELNIDMADVAIIYTQRPDRPELCYRKLTQASLSPLCSPDVARSLGQEPKIESIFDVTQLSLINAPDDWAAWLGKPQMIEHRFTANLEIDSYLTAIEAALKGEGVAIVPDFLVAEDIRLGRLVQPFARSVPQPGSWYLVYRRDQAPEERIVWFEKWIADQFCNNIGENRRD